jgi:hypothetical protein
VTKDSAKRTSLLLTVVPRAAVCLSAHHALGSFKKGSVATTVPLHAALDVILGKLVDRSLASPDTHHQRAAAAKRALGVTKALHSGHFARFPEVWDGVIGVPKATPHDKEGAFDEAELVKHVAEATVFGRSRDTLQWLVDEHQLLSDLARSLCSSLPSYEVPKQTQADLIEEVI